MGHIGESLHVSRKDTAICKITTGEQFVENKTIADHEQHQHLPSYKSATPKSWLSLLQVPHV